MFYWDLWEFPGYKVIYSTAFSIFIVHFSVDIILRFFVNIALIYLVGGAFNGGYRCLLYLSLFIGVIIGVCNIRFLWAAYLILLKSFLIVCRLHVCGNLLFRCRHILRLLWVLLLRLWWVALVVTISVLFMMWLFLMILHSCDRITIGCIIFIR